MHNLERADPPESRAMISQLHYIGYAILHHDGTDGDAVGEGLRHCKDIRVAVDGVVRMAP